MAAKPTRLRTLLRKLTREDAKLARDRERLGRLEPGGDPARPLEVASASLVEPRARSLPCVRCEGEVRVDEHVAEELGGIRLRIARVRCTACGLERPIYFRLGTTLPS